MPNDHPPDDLAHGPGETSLARDEFERQVHDALDHLSDAVYLQTSPLTRFVRASVRPDTTRHSPSLGRALGQALLDVIESLASGVASGKTSRGSKSQQVLQLRFVEGLEVSEIERRLSMSRSACYAEQQRVVRAVAAALWERWIGPDRSEPTRIKRSGVGEGTVEGPPDHRRHNLPTQLTSFVGREREMAEVRRLLGTTRLLTLTGTGGCGKTRLAYQVAGDLLEEYPDGVWVVELAALSDASLVPQAVAFVIEVREEPGQPLLSTLISSLRSRSLLLVLDNCEHLLDASAQLADALLRGCPTLRIVATSRESLGTSGETSYRVPSLSLPDARALPSVASLSQYEAVRLFVDRAVAAIPSFALTEDNSAWVAQVCRRLDGIPLAIELAAGRVRGLGVEQLASRLDDRFRLLTGGSRTALRRQQTLRATIDWSHDLLSAAERCLFRRLAVFAGGWTLEAAEAVCTGGEVEEGEVVDLLLRLVDRSLVVAEFEREPMRYRLAETIRQYAQEKLLESGEAEAVRDRHVEWHEQLVGQAWPAFVWGMVDFALVDRLELEQDNLRAALDWSLARDEDASRPMRIVPGLYSVADRSGHYSELRELLEAVLARPGGEPLGRAIALGAAAITDLVGGNWHRARARQEQALAIVKAIGDKRLIALGLMGLASSASDLGERDEARALQEQALSLARELGDRRTIAAILVHLTITLYLQGDDAAVRRLAEEGLSICRDLGDTIEAARFLNHLGRVAVAEGDLGHARALAEESLSVSGRGPSQLIALTLRLLGDIARAEGDYRRAEESYRDALARYREMHGQLFWTTSHLITLAGLWVAQGRMREAARLYGSVRGWLTSKGLPVPWFPPRGYERDEAAAREALGEAGWARAWAEGQAMTLEQAIDYALSRTEQHGAE